MTLKNVCKRACSNVEHTLNNAPKLGLGVKHLCFFIELFDLFTYSMIRQYLI